MILNVKTLNKPNNRKYVDCISRICLRTTDVTITYDNIS